MLGPNYPTIMVTVERVVALVMELLLLVMELLL
jgi:hypothetical protein